MHARTALALLGLASTAVATYAPQQLNQLRGLGQPPQQQYDSVRARSSSSSGSSSDSSEGYGYDDEDEDEDTSGCLRSASSFANSFPTPTGALESYLESYMETAVERYAATATATGAAAACDFLTSSPPSMPAAVQSQYRSYDADVSSWYAARSGDMSAVAATCTAGDDDYASVFVARITQIVELVESFTATGCTATGTGSSGMASSTGAAAHSSTMTSSGGAAAATSTGSGKGSSDADSSSTKVDTGAAARPTALTAGFAAAAGVLAAAIML